jgi:tetratricopeptide (TPR) repeat protein
MPIAELDWASLSQLLDTVLALPRERRQEWLDALGAEHDSLKTVLRDLLSREDLRETGDFLATLPKLAAGTPVLSVDVASGWLIGPYCLEKQIGSGGMGTVWLADRIDGRLKRKVALKLPHLGGALPGLAERMARERDILAALEHPNIARLYDAGVAEDGRPYLAIEYVAGEPIDRFCEAYDLDVAERLELVLQVARAVAFAHARLIVHRDLKPSNIQVDAQGQVHLLDFGIARLLVQDTAPDSQHTLFAGQALTPDYASPEQICGEPVGTASDVYSLGVVLYELLTGRRPYKLGVGLGSLPLAHVILSSEPVRPSVAAESPSVRRKLRGDLDNILLKALKREPRERYAAAVEFEDDIERYLRGEPVRARRDSPWYRVGKFITRHKFPVAVAAAALLAVLVAAGLAVREARVAVTERDRALALSARNQASSEFQSMLITEAAQSDKPMTVVDMLARSEELAKGEFGAQPELLAAVLGTLAGNYHTMGEDARAEPLLKDALQAVLQSPDPALRAELTCRHALVMGALGKADDATRILQAMIGDPHTSIEQSAQCLEDLAFLAQDANDAAGAMKYGNLAWQRIQLVPHVSANVLGTYLGSIGYAYHLNDRNDLAERYYAQALAKFAQAGRASGQEAISVRNNWAIVSDGSGNPKRALELYDETVNMTAKYGNDAPPPYLMANRARALDLIGRFADSRTAYGQCIESSEKSGSGSATAYCRVGLCNVLRQLGDLPAAKDQCNKAATLIGASVAHSPAEGALQMTRGQIALSEGKFDEARAAFDNVLEQQPASSTGLIGRAEVNLHAGRLAAGGADARAALAKAQSLQGGLPYSNKTGLAWLILGRVLKEQGDLINARAAFESAVAHLSKTVDADHPALQSARRLLAASSTESAQRGS